MSIVMTLSLGRPCRLFLTAALALIGFHGTGRAADLPTYGRTVQPTYRPIAPPPSYGTLQTIPEDTPPASFHGYYGYYGYDLGGVPYEGLYSETTVCLRSVRTAYGYETVDVCRH